MVQLSYACKWRTRVYSLKMKSPDTGILSKIFIAPDKGVEMTSIEEVMAIAGVGLDGDRYALGIGAYSKSKIPKVRHVSLISREAIRQANNDLTQPLQDVSDLEFMTRRNLVTEGVDLTELVGEPFSIGSISLRGVEVCEPCKRPERLSSEVAGFNVAFQNSRGGLRAEILSSGLILVGDVIR